MCVNHEQRDCDGAVPPPHMASPYQVEERPRQIVALVEKHHADCKPPSIHPWEEPNKISRRNRQHPEDDAQQKCFR